MTALFDSLEMLELIVCAGMLAITITAIAVAYWMLRTIRLHENTPAPDACPLVTLVIPCKGAEDHLADHLAAHFRYDYPSYEIVFTVADENDAAVPVVRKQIAVHPDVPARLVIAPRLPNCVEKISNQLAAFATADPRSEVFACADSDGIPRDRLWLRALVAELGKHAVATGFRWYFPEDRSLVGILQSAWDSTWCIYHALEGTVWGGAMAFTRKTYNGLNFGECLSRGVTDDLVVLACTRAGGGSVGFAPGAMVGSRTHRRLGDFLTWAVRQAALVRLVTPRIWLRGFLAANLYAFFYVLTPLLLIWPGSLCGRVLPAAALGVVLLLNLWRGRLRYRVAAGLFPGWEEETRPLAWRYTWSVPLSDLLAPYVAYRSLAMRVIRWRGVGYRVLKDRVVRLSEPPVIAGTSDVKPVA